MKKIRITYIKVPKIIQKNAITELAEQVIHYEGSQITLPIPDGYAILTVTEYLQDLTINEPPLPALKN